ncbi:MAG TPA: NrsF family protein, partial [Vicinamibacterales bacterium]|nr:NrsF family protein [Vicinamibacterales bacterium]
MRTEDLIVSLARSATPVRVIRPVRIRFAQWVVVAFAAAAVVVFAVGSRADFPLMLGQPRYLLPATAMLATAILSAAAAFALSIPGREWSWAQRLVPLTTAALWGALLIVWLREGADGWARIAAMPIHLLCVLLIAVLASLS